MYILVPCNNVIMKKNLVFIAQIYESSDSFKVNDVVEFIGVLSNDPLLANFPADDK